MLRGILEGPSRWGGAGHCFEVVERWRADRCFLVQCWRALLHATSYHRRDLVLQDRGEQPHHLWLELYEPLVRPSLPPSGGSWGKLTPISSLPA